MFYVLLYNFYYEGYFYAYYNFYEETLWQRLQSSSLQQGSAATSTIYELSTIYKVIL